MADTPKLENVRAALRNLRGKAALAEKVGCSENNLHKIASGYTRHPGSEIVDAICRELDLDPVTGLPLPAPEKPSYRGVLRKGAGKHAPGRSAKYDAQAPMLTEKEASVEELPGEIELTEEEMRTIISARKGPKDIGELKVRMVAMGTPDTLAEAIFQALDGDYARAVELLARLMTRTGRRAR